MVVVLIEWTVYRHLTRYFFHFIAQRALASEQPFHRAKRRFASQLPQVDETGIYSVG
jgi:hypothetical protein